ncbi:glycosyltransferase [mine drainage metagenome]|uniref:Glycosyltransferase n=1 Tax=mine drainage metagenome TaxID=410659 RepID=T0YPN0_9ZZZZ
MENESANLKLTVILRIHGRNQYYKSAINTILNQTFNASLLEIIILTNLKEVSEYLSSFNNLNVHIYLYKKATEGEALWEGIKLSNGDVICFLDDDDLWRKDRLQVIMNVFDEFHKLVS